MYLVAILAILTGQYEDQTPHFNWMLPEGGEIEARYQCASEVRFRLAFGASKVEVSSYSGSSGEASPQELAQWNQWLEPLESIDNYDFACIGESERLIIQGQKRSDKKTSSLLVYWHAGEMRRLTDSFAPEQ